MKKILLPTLDYPPRTGGVARYLESMKQTLGDDMDVLFFQNRPSRLSLLWTLWKQSQSYEQIWTSHILPIGTMLWILSFLRVRAHGSTPLRYSIFLHGMDFDLARRSAWKRWLSKQIFIRAQHVFANSHALSREVEDFCSKKTEVILPCVTDALIETSGVIRSDRTLRDHLVLLTVARLVERKGHMDVLEVVRTRSNLHYTIVGDGPMRATILQYIQTHGLQDRVTLLQGVPDRKLPSLYAEADLFVMPTLKSQGDREGFGIVYLEAQLFGLPVIAMRHPGVDEAVIDGVGGVFIDEVNELAGAIDRLVADRELRARLGERGAIFVKERFTREKQFGVLRAYV